MYKCFVLKYNDYHVSGFLFRIVQLKHVLMFFININNHTNEIISKSQYHLKNQMGLFGHFHTPLLNSFWY